MRTMFNAGQTNLIMNEIAFKRNEKIRKISDEYFDLFRDKGTYSEFVRIAKNLNDDKDPLIRECGKRFTQLAVSYMVKEGII